MHGVADHVSGVPVARNWDSGAAYICHIRVCGPYWRCALVIVKPETVIDSHPGTQVAIAFLPVTSS
jgi:hypothetical protein